MERSPSAHVKRTVLPNGHTRTVIDDPKRDLHAVIDRNGNTITSIAMSSPRAEREDAIRRHHAQHAGRSSGQPHVESVATTFSLSYFDLGTLFSLTVPIGLLAATLLAGPLAKENDGHLELAWTKPLSRERYALSAVLVDVSALIVAQMLAAVALLLGAALWEIPKVSFERLAAAHVAFALVAPIAWYACLTACSAIAQTRAGRRARDRMGRCDRLPGDRAGHR